MVVLLVKQEDHQQTAATPVNNSLPVQQELTGGGGSVSRSESSASHQSQAAESHRQSRKDFFESAKSSKSMSLKSQLKSPFRFLGKTQCGGCKKKCSGEVLRVNDKYFHSQCFKCVECSASLSAGGFFTKDGRYYCTKCYQSSFGTKCAKCNLYVEGEVVSALGNTFHQKCFTCARCEKPFPTGERVTFTGKNCLCQQCIQAEKEVDSRLLNAKPSTTSSMNGHSNGHAMTAATTPTMNGSPSSNGGLLVNSDACAGCNQELRDGQALVALDKQYHIWCFKCTTCGVLLHGEYMGHEGKPYCEKDYHERYGVKCAYCQRFISGKVLQAGDNNHFHPTCARCSKCGDPFGDGEEMYLQGAAIWHPRCGPGPGESGFVINGYDTSSMVDGFDGLSSTMSELHYGGSRASSPGGSLLRDYRSQSPGIPFAYSYIRQGRSVSSLRRPIDPYDRKASHPPMHFHVPAEKGARKVSVNPRSASRTGMREMVTKLAHTSPRPRSPHMNNEEPIEMSHYPDGKKIETEHVVPIERDDFPAPPFLYADPERRRRWSEPMKKEDSTEIGPPPDDQLDSKLKNQEETLRKISSGGSGLGKVFLDTVKQREKMNAQRRAFIDPRSYARTPSATREPQFRLRYDSPVNASPSRLTHSRMEEEPSSTFYRSSSGRSLGTPGYTTPGTVHSTPSYRIVSSLGGPPKPGYTSRKSSTLPAHGVNGSLSPGYSQFEAGLDPTYSAEFSSRSDLSEKSSVDLPDGRVSSATVNRRDLKSSTTYTQGLRNMSTSEHSGRNFNSLINRSLPNMATVLPKAPKIYPIHLLLTNNYRLPNDVDRCNLERHLSDTDFELVFEASRPDFYRLPLWRRNELKKRVKLF